MNVHLARARQRARVVPGLAAVVASVAIVSSAAGHSGTTLSAFGTPVVDGVLAAGEWDGAARIDFSARVPSNDGGGTTPGSLFVMNDAANLYFAVRVSRPGAPRGSFLVEFDNDHDAVLLEQGDDGFVANPGSFFADFFRTTEPPCPAGFICGLLDTQLGGTADGLSATGSGTFVYEVSKPLDSADDAHDISLVAGDTVGLGATIQVWSIVPACNFGSSCVEETSIAAGADIVVAGSDTAPPALDTPTVLSADATGPAGAAVAFAASATDDVDGPVPVTCSRASGSVFPIGTTTVTCTATDAAGNAAGASFDVHVKSAAEQLADLQTAVTGIGTGTSLADKIRDATAALAAGQQAEACGVLAAFAKQVGAQSGKSISPAAAAELLASAGRIRSVVAC